MEALHFLEANWGVIRAAPFAFLTTIVLTAGLTYYATKRYLADRVETLEERRRLAEDLIASYREKLQGASPEEAQARITALEVQLDRLKFEASEDRKARAELEDRLADRTITDDTKSRIAETLRRYEKQEFTVIAFPRTREVIKFSSLLTAEAIRSGWIFRETSQPPLVTGGLEGVTIHFAKGSVHQQEAAMAFAEVLNQQGILARCRPALDTLPANIVRVMVGAKPT